MPLNILGGIPTIATDYSPLWDLNVAQWVSNHVNVSRTDMVDLYTAGNLLRWLVVPSADMIPTVLSQAAMLSDTTWIGGSRGFLGVPSSANSPVTTHAVSSNPVHVLEEISQSTNLHSLTDIYSWLEDNSVHF